MNNIDLMNYWFDSADNDFDEESDYFIKEVIDTGIKVAYKSYLKFGMQLF